MPLPPGIIPNQLQQQAAPARPMPSPSQVADAHAHLTDMQKGLDKLIKLPDDELTTQAIYGAASDLITKYKLSKGKRGAPAISIAKELSAPDFPAKGAPPATIRAFLQKQFDKAAVQQAKISATLGKPQPQMPMNALTAPMPQPQPQQDIQPPSQLQGQ